MAESSRRSFLSGLAAAAGGLMASRGAAEDATAAIMLATANIKLRLDPQQGWAPTLSDAECGQELARPARSPLFELTLVDRDGADVPLPADRAEQVRTTRLDGNGHRLEFLRLGGRDIDVCCELRGREDGALHFGASIRNATELPLRAMRYPIFALTPPPGNADCYLLAPMVEVFALVRNPHRMLPTQAIATKWLRETGLFGRSPGNLAAQFAAYYGGQAGLYTAALDGQGWLKELSLERTAAGVRLSWLHFFPEVAARQQAIAYPIELRTFRGDWYDAADLYKAWAHRQRWCAKTICQRDDVPEWIKRGSLWLSVQNAAPEADGSLRYFGEDLARLMARWREVLPQPPVLHYRRADKYVYGGTFLDWKPFFPSDEAYATTLAAQKKYGVRAWLMLNGYNLTLTAGSDGKGGYAHDERERFQREAAPYAVRDAKGQIGTWQQSWIPNSTEVELCRGTPWAQQFLNDLAEHSARNGFSLCQMDQTVGGGGDICRAKNHGHPPGGGTWFSGAFRRQLRSIAAIGRKYDPQFSTSEEGPNELFIQQLGTFQSRDHVELPFYVYERLEKPWDVRVVPVFAYLYHRYIIGYTSWVGMGAGFSQIPISEQDWETVGVTALAKSLVYGKLPGVFEATCTPGRASRTKRFRLLLQHAALTGGQQRRYLLFGEMLRPPPLETDTVTFTFQYRPPLQRDYPRVLHGAFEDADGKRAVFLVNVSDEEAKCTLDLAKIAAGRKHLDECRLCGGKVARSAGSGTDRLALTLAPLEVMYVELW